MRTVSCYKCKTIFGLSEEIYNIATERSEKFSFYCPNGHPQCFAAGQTEEEKLRQERDRLKQKLAQKDDEIAQERRQREATERQVASLKKRAKAGMCPCCKRTFSNMLAHMESKHPDMDPHVVDLSVEKEKRVKAAS